MYDYNMQITIKINDKQM